MKLILADEAMAACARLMEPENVPGDGETEEHYEADIRTIYQAAALIAVQPGTHPEGTDYRIPVPDWLAERVFG